MFMRNRIKIEMVYDYMKNNNLSKTKFCKLCNIIPAIFKKIEMFNLSGRKVVKGYNFNIATLFKIAKFIGVKLYEFFEN